MEQTRDARIVSSALASRLRGNHAQTQYGTALEAPVFLYSGFVLVAVSTRVNQELAFLADPRLSSGMQWMNVLSC